MVPWVKRINLGVMSTLDLLMLVEWSCCWPYLTSSGLHHQSTAHSSCIDTLGIPCYSNTPYIHQNLGLWNFPLGLNTKKTIRWPGNSTVRVPWNFREACVYIHINIYIYIIIYNIHMYVYIHLLCIFVDVQMICMICSILNYLE